MENAADELMNAEETEDISGDSTSFKRLH